jgi:MFS family permease
MMQPGSRAASTSTAESLSADTTTPRIALIVLLLIYMLSAMDRQLVAMLAEPIRRDLNLSDTELGLLTGLAFAACYTIAGLPIAWFADRHRRFRLVGLACLSWSLFTALCGFTHNFTQIFLCRMGVGIGESGGTAPSLSLISDLFRSERRAQANGIFTLGTPLGVLCGSLLVGWIAPSLGWRACFYMTGAIGLILAPLVLILRDPKRGGQDTKASGAALSFLETLAYFRRPVVFMLTINGALTAFVGNSLLAWTPALLMRSHGMTIAQVGLWYGVMTGASLGLGSFLGGVIVGHFARRDIRMYALLPSGATLLAIPFLIGALTVEDWRLDLLLLAGPGFLAIFYFAPTVALLHTLIPPRGRTQATAILLLVIQLVGLGLGPLMIGLASDALRPSFGEEALQTALFLLAPVLLLVSMSYIVMARFLRTEGGSTATLNQRTSQSQATRP